MPKVIQVIESSKVWTLGKGRKGTFILTEYYDLDGKELGYKHDLEYIRWQGWVRNQGSGKRRGK
jgi:hypothetical protein